MKRQAGFIQIGILVVALLAAAAGYFAFQTYNQSQDSVVGKDQPSVTVVRNGDDLQAMSEEVDQLVLEDSEAELADIEASLNDF